jgi:hypothetical protein
MNSSSRAAARFTSDLACSCSTYIFTALMRIASLLRARCGRTNYNRSFVQRCSLPSLAADPDERRARGPHSLAADSPCCRRASIAQAMRAFFAAMPTTAFQ